MTMFVLAAAAAAAESTEVGLSAYAVPLVLGVVTFVLKKRFNNK